MESYKRFYAIFNRLPYSGEREELKKSLVLQYTSGRTEHLHEMMAWEYDACCRGLEKQVPGSALGKTPGECTVDEAGGMPSGKPEGSARWMKAGGESPRESPRGVHGVGGLMGGGLYFERKRWRSAALHQLQLYGVDTTDWGKVNAFCKQARIAGKAFRELDCEELAALTKKMRAIIRKRDKNE